MKIIDALRSSLENLHTVKVGYISLEDKASERQATVNYIDEEKGIVNFATNIGFRSMRLENIVYAEI